ncbi:hypothetical protein [Limnohabitans sp. 2KL-17]|uniref:hypothetical protein n=1 Tax=Limnohabitans sp. 2KL-17 TaxID=1100704 RepID=UPI0011B223A0|nr:hypothetical protein [Limnohabitans sp. 2KL-17]
MQQHATKSAQTHADSVAQFRNFYIQELVTLAVKGCLEISHDYKSLDSALPLPATLTIDLEHFLSKVDGSVPRRLLSPIQWE